MNRLERVGCSHPSRTIVFAVDPARDTLDARVSISCATGSEHGAPAPCRERVEISVGPRHLPHLSSVAAPILLSDLPTVVWAPHRHEEAIGSLITLADAILVDSLEEPSVERAIRGARALTDRAHVVDLAWVRDAPWRERIADLFETPEWRRAPFEISGVTLSHAAGSGMASLLLVGWLGSRLQWKPRPLFPHDGALHAKLRGRRQHVDLSSGSPTDRCPRAGTAWSSRQPRPRRSRCSAIRAASPPRDRRRGARSATGSCSARSPTNAASSATEFGRPCSATPPTRTRSRSPRRSLPQETLLSSTVPGSETAAENPGSCARSRP